MVFVTDLLVNFIKQDFLLLFIVTTFVWSLWINHFQIPVVWPFWLFYNFFYHLLSLQSLVVDASYFSVSHGYAINFQLICRGVYPPAADYLNRADRSQTTLVDAFRNMQIEDAEPLENGDFDHEVYYSYLSVFLSGQQHIKHRNCFHG